MKPVFIGGCHRSGTTFLGALLGAHPACLTTPESQFKLDALQGADVPVNHDELKVVLNRARQLRSFRRWGLDASTPEIADDDRGPDYAGLLQKFVSAYGDKVGQTSFDLWIDHTPKNIRSLDTLFSLFPEGRAIHLVRDGRGVAASVMPLDWGPNTIIAAAHWWVHHISFGLAAELHYGSSRVLRVRYEDLVANPGVELERICTWLDIEYDADMAQGGGFNFAGGTFRYHGLVHDAPDSSRATAWRQSLSTRQIKTFDSRVCDLLIYLGYDQVDRLADTALIDRAQLLLLEPLMIAVNTLRFRYGLAKEERFRAKSAALEKRDA